MDTAVRGVSVQSITIRADELARTFTLIARPDTHQFLEHDLVEYLESLAHGAVPLRKYIDRLRSGEYVPKAGYSDSETDYVYLTIGQFSGSEVTFDDLTFLDPAVGADYEAIAVSDGDLVVTRSGTVGVSHIFRPPDTKTYIPSHHLAVLQVGEDPRHSREYLRLLLQSSFARRYFWAFASGKGQKEISNWSIKSLPVPQTPDPHAVADEVLAIEREIEELRAGVREREEAKGHTLFRAVRSDSV